MKSPAWNTGQRNSEKSPQSMFKTRVDTFGNDFGLFWNFDYFWVFWKLSKAGPSMEHGAFFFSKKVPQNMFKRSLDNFGTILGIFAFLNFLWFFRKLSMTPWNTGQKNIFKKIAPKHVWTLGNVFGHFRNFEFFYDFFSLIFSKSLPQGLSPENWTQVFQVRQTELIFLSSGFWTHNFKSRISEVELRLLTVAWMKKECLLSSVS